MGRLPKTFVINLKRRGDKRDLAVQECAQKKLCASPTIFQGVDGEALSRKQGKSKLVGNNLELSWKAPGNRGRRVRIVRNRVNKGTEWGTLGCAMSHEKLLKQVSDRDRTLILEDDIKLCDDAGQCLKFHLDYLDDVHPNWQLLMLGGSLRDKWAKVTRNAKVSPRRVPQLRYCEYAYLSHGYVIRKAAIPTVLKFLAEGSPSDSALMRLQTKSPKQCFIIAAPQLATQDKKLKSDIRQASSQPVGGTEKRLAPNGFQAIQLQTSWQQRP